MAHHILGTSLPVSLFKCVVSARWLVLWGKAVHCLCPSPGASVAAGTESYQLALQDGPWPLPDLSAPMLPVNKLASSSISSSIIYEAVLSGLGGRSPWLEFLCLFLVFH